MEPYSPALLPLKEIDWIRIISLIGTANAELARYDGIIHGIINPHILLSPLLTKEAVLSSRIEGTLATLEEVLEFEAYAKTEIKTEHDKDIQEIINYRKSIKFALDWLSSRPITLNMIKEIHNILLNSVRGKDKGRGRFRTVQNWIGRLGMPIEKADYVPPEPTALKDYLSNLEKYIHHEEKDRLVQLAIIHAQFEIIHPFIDGNGRLGRILIPLFLYEKGLLSTPMFYISEYLEGHRDEYYKRLRGISSQNNWVEWIEFFLKAVLEQSRVNSSKAKAVLDLYEEKKERVQAVTHSQYVIKILDTLFLKPIFSTSDFVRESGIPHPSAMRILQKLNKEDIINIYKKGSGRKPSIFIFKKLLDIIG